jgi:hypothetical protein
MNTGNTIRHKIMALFQRVLSADGPDHLGISFATLQRTLIVSQESARRQRAQAMRLQAR